MKQNANPKQNIPDPDPVVEAYKKELDPTLLYENLRLTPHQRVEQLVQLLKIAEELKRAGEKSRRNA